MIETENGKVLKINTRDPVGNTFFIDELKAKLTLVEKNKERKLLIRSTVMSEQR